MAGDVAVKDFNIKPIAEKVAKGQKIYCLHVVNNIYVNLQHCPLRSLAELGISTNVKTSLCIGYTFQWRVRE